MNDDDIDMALVKLLPMYRDTQVMLKRLVRRVDVDMLSADHPDIVYLHRRVVALERSCQEREAQKREGT